MFEDFPLEILQRLINPVGSMGHTLSCNSSTPCVKMVAFQFCIQLGKQKSSVGGGDSNVVFGQKFPCEKGSVRWCAVMQQAVFLSLPQSETKGVSSHSLNRHSNIYFKVSPKCPV
jgi:hypothetical protein